MEVYNDCLPLFSMYNVCLTCIGSPASKVASLECLKYSWHFETLMNTCTYYMYIL